MLLGLGVLGALALALWYASNDGVRAGEPDLGRVVTAKRQDVIDSVTASGRVEPLARVAVMSRASGIIKELLVEEGDVVEEGQVLAELDREQLQAQHAENEAGIQGAKARVDAAVARVEEARVRIEDPELEFLEREAARMDELFAEGAVSVKDREEAHRTLANARFRVELVRANVPVLEAARAEAEAGLASAQAALERTETGLREATVRCPMSGVVLVRDKEVGDGVSSILTAGGNATQIMTLGDLSRMHIEARADEVDLGQIHEDMSALVTVDAHRGTTLSGRVQRIAPAGSIDDNGIVTFEVRIEVEDPDRILRPDMTADAKLVKGKREGVVVLPQIAIRRGTDGTWSVDKLVGDSAVRTEVSLGLSDGLLTEITDGIVEGDQVLLPDARN